MNSYCNESTMAYKVPLPSVSVREIYLAFLWAKIAESQTILQYDVPCQALVPFLWYVHTYHLIPIFLSPDRPALSDPNNRVPVHRFDNYKATHEFRSPGCLCPVLNGTMDNESVVFEASGGEYIAVCAKGICGYVGESCNHARLFVPSSYISSSTRSCF